MGSGAWTPAVAVTVRIRDAEDPDLRAILGIERLSFPDPWSAAMFRTHLHDPMYPFLVVEEERALLGFAIAQTVVADAELLDIAVHPDARSRGIGAALLEALLVRCAIQGAAAMTLEVRESNDVARTLYKQYGFAQVGRRRRYYRDPVEDALILRATLPTSTKSPVGLR